MRDALDRARGGSIARCDGLALDVVPTVLRFPTQAAASAGGAGRDPLHVPARLRLGAARSTRGRREAVCGPHGGYGRAGVAIVVSLQGRKLGTGRYASRSRSPTR